MTYDVDQSGKVENTEKNTVICVSNGRIVILLLRRGPKRLIQKYFRSLNRGRDFVLFTFAAMVGLALDKIDKNNLVVIDTEYPGKNHIIKKLII